MTGPDELRLWIEDLYELKGDVAKHATRLRAAADAWERQAMQDLRIIEALNVVVADKQARIEELEKRLEAAENIIKWVLNDMCYTAPEASAFKATIWYERLSSALAGEEKP